MAVSLKEVDGKAIGEIDLPVEALTSTSAALQTSRPARRRSSVTKPASKARPSAKKHDSQRLLTAIEADAKSAIAYSPTAKPMPAGRPLPLLICSIGNPGSQYANTLHSAGHTVLNYLAERLGYQQFQKDRTWGNGLLSKPSSAGSDVDWTLWQSTSYMNDSGKGVRAAHMAWSRTVQDSDHRLVIIHDELEKPLGAVSLRTTQGASAKGHNGLKSIMGVIGNTSFARIGIGIGRPVSRASDDVARYVLQKMTPAEKSAMEACVEQVVNKLRQLEKG